MATAVSQHGAVMNRADRPSRVIGLALVLPCPAGLAALVLPVLCGGCG